MSIRYWVSIFWVFVQEPQSEYAAVQLEIWNEIPEEWSREMEKGMVARGVSIDDLPLGFLVDFRDSCRFLSERPRSHGSTFEDYKRHALPFINERSTEILSTASSSLRGKGRIDGFQCRGSRVLSDFS